MSPTRKSDSERHPEEGRVFLRKLPEIPPERRYSAVKWTLNGKQARFYCKKCNDAIKARTMGETA